MEVRSCQLWYFSLGLSEVIDGIAAAASAPRPQFTRTMGVISRSCSRLAASAPLPLPAGGSPRLFHI